MNNEKNIKTLIVKKPLKLDCGKTIKDFPIAYETYGSLNTKKDNYVFVSYQGNKGTISENSIGGSNTNLLPNGAKVIEIDSKKSHLKINFDNEDYIFEF